MTHEVSGHVVHCGEAGMSTETPSHITQKDTVLCELGDSHSQVIKNVRPSN
jgi:uncharacterized Zn-binding protein involved in type VI secretion